MKANKHLPNPFNPESSPYLSYILGVIQGDGSIYRTTQKYSYRRDRIVYMIHLSVREKAFAEEFAYALSKIFDRKVNVIECDEKSGRGIFYKVFLASKEFYWWYHMNDVFQWGAKHPDKFIKGFFDSDGSFNYFKSKGYKYPVARMFGDDKIFLERLQKLLESEYEIKSRIVSRGVSKPTVLNKRTVFWRKELFELGIFNKSGMETFLKLVEGSIKLKNKLEGCYYGRGVLRQMQG